MAFPALIPDLSQSPGNVPDLTDTGTRQRLSAPALEAFFRIAEIWKLRNDDAMALLGGVSNGRYYDLKKHRRGILTQDELTRISLLTGIFKSLNILFQQKLADEWVIRPNSHAMFSGAPPLVMLIRDGVPGILNVRRLLDGRRGGR
ncbi:antitoxin Xre-like helix-turn-helix domain-containing protein [Paracidobacterium acidisoli]|uniref:DUF2384 domain-containing protein n=1 Tax=Paracidobacterium acidisoli TaxID=2303751 RepID=A0A372IUV2_9BACT|nr:antitoxin Xre-like helix-turn-helix domain-containing protein [Paracidobacterium acidisoli]MBT9329697.1 MbcA/ParS/Xre antitoxin family protein [Paracidobacterium acidisoli]